MTDEQIVAELRSSSKWNQARAVFSHACASIEQAQLQRRPLSPIETRGQEFEAVRKILAIYQVEP